MNDFYSRLRPFLCPLGSHHDDVPYTCQHLCDPTFLDHTM